MGTINFYQNATEFSQRNYTYADLRLDLAEDVIVAKNKKSKSDIAVDYDVSAVRNSITNMFGTRKGQRPLEPTFGINLDQYLFEPISTFIAQQIGEEIKSTLKFDDRVAPLRIDVTVLASEDGYRVDLLLYISSLGVNTLISANLSRLTREITIL